MKYYPRNFEWDCLPSPSWHAWWRLPSKAKWLARNLLCSKEMHLYTQTGFCIVTLRDILWESTIICMFPVEMYTFARQMAPEDYVVACHPKRSFNVNISMQRPATTSELVRSTRQNPFLKLYRALFVPLSLVYFFCNEAVTSYVADDFHGFWNDRNFHLTKDSILIGYGRTALPCFMARVATQAISFPATCAAVTAVLKLT